MDKTKIIIENVKDRLGIDVRKYESSELIDKVTQILFIQKYAIKKVVTPILIALVIFFLGFFLLDLRSFEYLIYGIFGLLFLVGIGLLAGLIRFVSHLQRDFLMITRCSIQILNTAVEDMKNFQTSNFDSLKNPSALLFEGILVGLFRPKVTTIFQNKPIIGSMTIKVFDKTVDSLLDKYRILEDKFKTGEKIRNVEERTLRATDRMKEIINTFLKTVDQSIRKTFSFIKRPLYFIAFLMIFFFMILLYIIS